MGETNWKDLRSSAMTVLTGEFPVVVVKAEAATSQNGKPMLKGSVKITSGTYVGREIRLQLTLSADNPIATKMFFLNLDAFGLGESYFDGNPSFAQIAADLLGREAIAVLAENEWNGVKSEQIKTLKKASGGFTAAAVPVAAVAVALPVPVATTTTTLSPADEEDPF